MKKAVVGMSGGVDSSVAAALLVKEGYEVLGVTMNLWNGDKTEGCTKLKAAADAKAVAEVLGISHTVVDFTDEFKSNVVNYFTEEYQKGRTPNPCVECNRKIKFGAMADYAKSVGADFVATGHYASKAYVNGRWYLKKSKAGKKDQTYFLYTLSPEQISRVIFPLENFEDKAQIRQIAKELNLPVFAKKDSQDICFIDKNGYVEFLKTYGNITLHDGDFIDSNGKFLGRHKGSVCYTIGQRKGLGIALGKPAFVLEINPEDNKVVLGNEEDLYRSDIEINCGGTLDFEELAKHKNLTAKIRYSALETECRVGKIAEDRAKIIFSNPQRAATRGQSAVIYSDDLVIGGGVID